MDNRGTPRYNSFSQNGVFYIEIPLPGVYSDDVSIRMKGDLLYVDIEPVELPIRDYTHHQWTQRNSDFSIVISEQVEASRASCELVNGVLYIAMPLVNLLNTTRVTLVAE